MVNSKGWGGGWCGEAAKSGRRSMNRSDRRGSGHWRLLAWCIIVARSLTAQAKRRKRCHGAGAAARRAVGAALGKLYGRVENSCPKNTRQRGGRTAWIRTQSAAAEQDLLDPARRGTSPGGTLRPAGPSGEPVPPAEATTDGRRIGIIFRIVGAPVWIPHAWRTCGRGVPVKD